jgi:signal transduction histidine kinase
MAILSNLNPFNFIADSGPERFAVGRVNILLARIFSIGGLAVGVQMLLNAWSQRFIINPWLFWPGFLAVAIGQVGLIYGAFFSGRNSFWQRWYARSIEFVIVTWFLGFPAGVAMPTGLYPWAWWGVGLAAVAAFAGLPPIRAITFFVSLDLFWFVARFFPAYGAVNVWLNLQDTVLTFLFAAVLGSLVMVTRYEASKVDEASKRQIAAATEQARAEAEIREKSRLDALVHDKVLTTLLMAAKAQSPEGQKHAAELAITAVTALNTSPSATDGAPISGANFFDALVKIAAVQKPDLVISRDSVDAVLIPELVATALTEATLQAIVNSTQHAGPAAVTELHLKAHRDGLKIVVKDNGRGFRLSRVPKNRLGIRVSIIERVELVGGRVFVDSRPGAGSNIIIEWSGNA